MKKKVDVMIADAMPEETTPYLVYRRSTSDNTETHTHLSSAALDFSFHYLEPLSSLYITTTAPHLSLQTTIFTRKQSMILMYPRIVRDR